MWRKFREWFELTKSEERGIITLLVLLCVLWGINFYLKHLIRHRPPSGVNIVKIEQDTIHEAENTPNTKPTRYEFIGFFNPNEISYEDLIRSGLQEKSAKSIVNYRNKGGKFFRPAEIYKIFNIDSSWVAFHLPYMSVEQKSHDKPMRTELFMFNPNTADSLEFIRLGFKPWQITNLLRYRARGGKFFKKDDVKRLYGIDSNFYARIEPYIDLPSAATETTTQYPPKGGRIIEVNTADSTTLTTLPGIGPVLAGRIVKYRNALGGFVEVGQLMEIYGIDSLKWEGLLPLIEVNSHLIRRIDINTAEEAQLASHPYIRAGLAREIVAFRKNFRLFQSVSEIEKLSLARNRDLRRLYPYLSTGEN